MTTSPPPTATLSPELLDRYLAVLGVERTAPSYDAFAALIRAHKKAVPFENITAILRRNSHRDLPTPPIDAEALISNWEQRRGGGVCFELGEMFWRLLSALGYDATRIFGSVRLPGDHQAVLVKIAGRRYLADVGSGTPAVVPIPLDDGVVEFSHAGVPARYRPGETDTEWLGERWVDGDWVNQFRFDLDHPAAGVPEQAYQRHHTPGYSFVVGGIVLVRCTEDAIFQLRGGSYSKTTAVETTEIPIDSTADYERVLREEIGMPALPVAKGIDALAELLPAKEG